MHEPGLVNIYFGEMERRPLRPPACISG